MGNQTSVSAVLPNKFPLDPRGRYNSTERTVDRHRIVVWASVLFCWLLRRRGARVVWCCVVCALYWCSNMLNYRVEYTIFIQVFVFLVDKT